MAWQFHYTSDTLFGSLRGGEKTRDLKFRRAFNLPNISFMMDPTYPPGGRFSVFCQGLAGEAHLARGRLPGEARTRSGRLLDQVLLGDLTFSDYIHLLPINRLRGKLVLKKNLQKVFFSISFAKPKHWETFVIV